MPQASRSSSQPFSDPAVTCSRYRPCPVQQSIGVCVCPAFRRKRAERPPCSPRGEVRPPCSPLLQLDRQSAQWPRRPPHEKRWRGRGARRARAGPQHFDGAWQISFLLSAFPPPPPPHTTPRYQLLSSSSGFNSNSALEPRGILPAHYCIVWVCVCCCQNTADAAS